MEDFVTFEISKKLKEKGFKQGYNTFGYKPVFSDENTIKYISDIGAYEKDYFGENISCPTISQVLKWLREEKNVSIDISIHCSLKWVYSLHIFDEDLFMDLTPYTDLYTDGVVNDTIYELYDSYEEAALAGIEYALDNLDNLFDFQ